jgi:hypothetical protein
MVPSSYSSDFFLNTSDLTIRPIGSIWMDEEEFWFVRVAYMHVLTLAYAPARSYFLIRIFLLAVWHSRTILLCRNNYF